MTYRNAPWSSVGPPIAEGAERVNPSCGRRALPKVDTEGDHEAAVATATLLLTGMNALVQAVNTMTDYGCKHGWWEAGCAITRASVRN